MSFLADIRTHFLSNSKLFGLVGNRIHEDLAPHDSVLPYVVYQDISDANEIHLRGATDLSSATVQYSVFAESIPERNAVSRAIYDIFHVFSGTVGKGKTDIRMARQESRINQTEDPNDGRGTRIFSAVLTYSIAYRDYVPVSL